MQSSKFWALFKKYQQYLYLSMLLIAIFFIGSSLINQKITSATEDLVQDIIQGNLKSKENIVAFEFKQLNNSLKNAQKILNNSENNSFESLKEKLLFISDLTLEHHSIHNSFVSVVSSNGVLQNHFSNKKDSLYQKEINTFLKKTLFVEDEVLMDTVITEKNSVINRKIYVIETY